jgi:hypothetical protein
MLEWLQNPVVAIGLAIVAMFFGYFFGLFEGRGQGYKKRQAEEPETEETEPASDPLPPVHLSAPSNEISVLDVSMDSAGRLRLNLEGERIEASTITPEQRKRIIAVLTQIRPFLEGTTQAQAQTPAPTPPPAPPRPVSPPREAPSAGTMSAVAPSSSSKPAPSPGKAKEEPVAAPESIVEQVDAILQSQMIGTPLMERGIRLQESPEGGVIVWVGMEKFEGVNEVPDEQIQAAIRAAISVWENKFTPGP